jgi:hypothetical protein
MEAVASQRLWPSQEVTMTRDVMVGLDGGISDEVRLADTEPERRWSGTWESTNHWKISR